MARRQSSSEVVFFALNASARVARKARAILESQLDAMTAELTEPGISPKRRGEILLASAEILALLERLIVENGKLLIKPNVGAGHEPKDSTISAEDIVLELTKGKKLGRGTA